MIFDDAITKWTENAKNFTHENPYCKRYCLAIFFDDAIILWLAKNESDLNKESDTPIERALKKDYTQPVFPCLKLTIETLEQGVNYVQS